LNRPALNWVYPTVFWMFLCPSPNYSRRTGRLDDGWRPTCWSGV